MQTEKTIFAKIIAGEIPCIKIYEDADTFAFLDIQPNAIGHTLVVPKVRYENIHELPDEIASAMFRTVKKIAGATKTALNSDGTKIIMNNGSASGQVVFHAHIHIIPRFEGDKFRSGEHLKYKDGEAGAVAAKIRAEIK